MGPNQLMNRNSCQSGLVCEKQFMPIQNELLPNRMNHPWVWGIRTDSIPPENIKNLDGHLGYENSTLALFISREMEGYTSSLEDPAKFYFVESISVHKNVLLLLPSVMQVLEDQHGLKWECSVSGYKEWGYWIPWA